MTFALQDEFLTTGLPKKSKQAAILNGYIIVPTGDVGLPKRLSGKESACQCRSSRRLGFNTWVKKIPGEGHGNPLQYFFLEKSTGRGGWQATAHGVAESDTTE